MNTLSESITEYPEDFEDAMREYFGLSKKTILSNIKILPPKDYNFSVSKLFTAILSGQIKDSIDVSNPSWDNIENNRKILKTDEIFPNASIEDLDKIYFAITIAIKKHLIDKKTLISYQPTNLNSVQYSIYAFVIDRFYRSLNSNKIPKTLSDSHDNVLSILDAS